MTYSIGYNMPGYMPDTEPYSVDTLDEAKACLIDEIDRYIDELDETDGFDMAASAKDLCEFINAKPQECNFYVQDYVFWITAN